MYNHKKYFVDIRIYDSSIYLIPIVNMSLNLRCQMYSITFKRNGKTENPIKRPKFPPTALIKLDKLVKLICSDTFRYDDPKLMITE